MIGKLPPPSPEQADILDVVRDSRDNIGITARAGTGKTTTLRMIAAELRRRHLNPVMVAFNRKIANELKEKGENARTLHSYGNRLLREHYPIEGEPVGGEQIDRDISQRFGLDGRDHESRNRWNATRALIAGAKEVGLMLDGYGTWNPALPRDSEEGWLAASNAGDAGLWSFMPSDQDAIVSAAREQLTVCVEGRMAAVSFADMLYVPVALGLRPAMLEGAVLIDEAQDLNGIQHAFLPLIMSDHTRTIIVGDDRQSVYTWRGALHDSLHRLFELHDVTWRKLATTRRCGHAIVAEAKRLVPDFEAHPDNPEGAIYHDIWANNLADMPHDLMILCRNNAPLFDLALKNLAGPRVPIEMIGRDFSGAIATVINKAAGKAGNGLPAQDLLERMEDRLKVLREKVADGDVTLVAEAARYGDMLACVRTIVTNTGAAFVAEVIAKLREVGASRGDGIRMGSIHSAKGLEADYVMILDPFLMPTGYARTEEDLLEEENLAYVAVTRAKHELIYGYSEVPKIGQTSSFLPRLDAGREAA